MYIGKQIIFIGSNIKGIYIGGLGFYLFKPNLSLFRALMLATLT